MTSSQDSCPHCGRPYDTRVVTPNGPTLNPSSEYSLAEAKQLLGLSQSTIYRLIKGGHLKAARFGEQGHWRFSGAAIEEFKRKRNADIRPKRVGRREGSSGTEET
jgi:excisionase family DNA binding protein